MRFFVLLTIAVLSSACADDLDTSVDPGAMDAASRDLGLTDARARDAAVDGPDSALDMGDDVDGFDLGDAGEEPDAEFSWPETVGCNGREEFCERSVADIAWVTTHNAMSSAEDGWSLPNQEFNMRRQLADGVRAFMIDTHPWEGDVYLCHGYCQIGNRLLLELLLELDAFLALYTDDVLVLMLENYVPLSDLDVVFTMSGLADRAYVHTGGGWPTLGELTEEGGRVIVFDNDDAGGLDWLNRTWDHAWETHYTAESLEDFDCAPNRGSTSSPLFILNHFITNPFPSADWSARANANPFFVERALACEAEHEQLPNFVTVDFYSLGDVFDVVDSLNGF